MTKVIIDGVEYEPVKKKSVVITDYKLYYVRRCGDSLQIVPKRIYEDYSNSYTTLSGEFHGLFPVVGWASEVTLP